MSAIGTDRQIGANFQRTARVLRPQPDHPIAVDDQIGRLGFHVQVETGIPPPLLGQEIQEIPLRHQRDVFADRREMAEIGELNLGVADQPAQCLHLGVQTLRGLVGNTEVQLADFSHLPTVCKYIALMPQWDFLNFLAEQGRRYPGFDLHMETEATDLIVDGDRVVGLRAQNPSGPLEVRADLAIGADGRHSTVRERAGFQVTNLGAPMDVLWMRLSRHPNDPEQTGGFINYGHMLVTLNRGDYWQCAFVIRKNGYDMVRARGLDAFRAEITRLAPYLADRVQELKDWDEIKLLTVVVDRLEKWWRLGLLCIGDAAHAMSPIGGVGVNLAVQDAVSAANILALPLREGRLTTDDLAAVQRRRTLPMKVIQAMQIGVQSRVIDPLLDSEKPITAPWAVTLFNRFPVLRRIPARIIGIGVRPEHVHSPQLNKPVGA